MELSIARPLLTTALARVQSIVDRRTSNPALAAVHLSATNSALTVTATDTLITLVADYTATVTAPGVATVDPATLFQVVKALGGAVVTLRLKGTRLHVVSGTAEHSLPIGNADDYPPIPTHKPGAALTLPGAALGRLIDESVFAASTDDNRYGLNGVHAEEVAAPDGANRLRFVTTDGSRLAYTEAPFEGRFGLGRKMLLPRKALGEVRKLATVDDAPWSITFGERTATFHTPGLTLHGRLIEGEFPDYRQVLPASFKRRVVVEVKPFAEALKNARVMANDRNHLTRFAFEADRVVLSAHNIDAGSSSAECPADYTGKALLTGFNLTFFQDIIAATAAARLSLELGEALDPCIVRVPDRDDCLFVVMPMRLE